MARIETNLLEGLYKEHSKKIYLYIFSLCRQRVIAEDLMQETFLKAFCSLQGSGEAILPWLFRVAKNLFLDECRKRKWTSPDEIGDLNIPDNTDILSSIIQNEQNRRLYSAINLLPAKEREIVVMYYFGGLGQDSIAEHLGLSPGNVRVLLHRTKKRLRVDLEKQEDEK